MKLEITDEERAIIIEMLDKSLAEIPIEIHHCSTNDFKDFLRGQLTKIEELRKKFN